MRQIFVMFFLILFSTASHAQEAKKIVIGVLLDGGHERETSKLSLYQNEIVVANGIYIPKGTSEPRKEEIVFPENYTLLGENTMESIEKQLDILLKERNVSMVLVMGPIGAKVASNKGLRGKLSKPVFAPIILDAGLQKIGNNVQIDKTGKQTVLNKSNVKNFYFIDSPYSILNDIEVFTEIFSFTSLAIVVDQGVAETIEGVANRRFRERIKFIKDIDIVPISGSAEKSLSLMGTLGAASQAFYIAGLYEIDSAQRKVLLKGITKMQKPSFSKQGYSDVLAGALGTLTAQSFEKKRAQLTATMIQRALDGEKLSELPIHINVDGRLTINMETASELGISPPWAVLAEAKKVRGSTSLTPQELFDNPTNLDAEGLSLGEAIKKAKEKFLKDVVETSNKVTLNDYVIARAAYLPQLEAAMDGVIIDADRAAQSLQYNPEQDVRVGARINQTLWSYEKAAQLKIEKTKQAIREQDYKQIEADLCADVGAAYLSLLHSRSVENALRDRLSRVRNYLDIARRRSDRDATAAADVFRMQAIRFKSKKDLLTAQSKSRHLEILFNRVVGLPIAGPVNLEEQDLITAGVIDLEYRLMSYVRDPRSFPAFSDGLVSVALKNHLDLKKMEHEKSLINQNIKVNLSKYWSPDISFSAGVDYHLYRTNSSYVSTFGRYNQLLSRLDTEPNLNASNSFSYNDYNINVPLQRDMLDWQVGVSMRLPLFDGLSSYGKVQKGKAQINLIDIQAERLKAQKEAALRGVIVTLNSSFYGIEFAAESKEAAAQGLQLTAQQYEEGARPLSDLNAASEDSLQAELFHIEALYDFRSQFFQTFVEMNVLDFYESKEAQDRLFLFLNNFFKDKGYFHPTQQEKEE